MNPSIYQILTQYIGPIYYQQTIYYESLHNFPLLFLSLLSTYQEARAAFRSALTESTQGLNAISKKLGSCIEKARPYYDAKQRAKDVSAGPLVTMSI